MSDRMRTLQRNALLTFAIVLALATPNSRTVLGAQVPLLQQVRAALAHGDVGEARRLASSGSGAVGGVATALVEIFTGEVDAAAARLAPLAQANPTGEAALELGLLELRRGNRADADRLLQPVSSIRNFAGPDDYFRMARAAAGVREYLLANDAYVRTADVPRSDIQTAWGDLFLLRYLNGDAATSYREAIGYDASWVPAHIGLARAFLNEDRETATQHLDAARQIAPEHPAVLELSALISIEEKEYDAARAELDRLAGVRRGSVEEAALRAALAYEDGGEAAAEAAMTGVAAADPTSALGYRYAAQHAARSFQFDAAARLARKGTELDPDDPYVHLDLGLYLMRTGDEAAARVALERSWDLDESAPLTKNLLDVLDDIDTFTVVDRGRMIFKFPPAEAAALEPFAVPLAEAAYAEFVDRYGFTPPEPILIEIFDEHDDFAVRTLGLPGLAGALGACFGRVVTLDSPTAREAGTFSWHATLWHELAHVFSLQLSGMKVPRWLTEGISGYEEYRRMPGWGRELTLEYARLVSQGRHFGVKGLPDAFKRPETLALAYFEASLVVEHLVDVNGEAGLRSLLRAYADGATDLDAFERAFGQTADQVDASFQQFVQARYGDLAAAMAPPPTQAAPDDLAALRTRAEAAPGNYESQVTYGRALLQAQQFDAARPVLERALELAPQARGGGSPRALLAVLAEAEGRVADARGHLRELLAFDHENVDAARKLAELSADAPDDLDFALQRIADLDPIRNPEVHGRLGMRLFEQGRFEDALVSYQVALAVGPPNVAEAHTDVAAALIELNRTAEAKAAALAALKEAPTYARAQDLLLRAIGRQP